MSKITADIIEFSNQRRSHINQLFDKSPYFPDFYKEGSTQTTPTQYEPSFVFSTKLRVLHEGVWYIAHHVEQGNNEERTLKMFLRGVYLSSQFLVINPEFVNADGEPLWKKDKLQISEEERLLHRKP